MDSLPSTNVNRRYSTKRNEPLEVQPDLSYVEQPIEILDQQDRMLGNKSVPLVKFLWRNPRVEKSTRELKSEMLDISILTCLHRLILGT